MIPEWKKKSFKIKYSLLHLLFENCFKVLGTQDDLIRRSLLLLDDNLVLPNSFKNIKRKTDKQYKKNPSSVVDEFYLVKDSNFIGEVCNKFGLNRCVIEKLINSDDNVELEENLTFHNIPLSFNLTNEIVLEIFKFKNTNSSFSWEDLKQSYFETRL